MKKHGILSVLLLVGILLHGSCTHEGRRGNRENSGSEKKISSIWELNDEKYLLGVETGTIAQRESENRLSRARQLQFGAPVDLYLALESGKVDAIVYDRPTLEYAAQNRGRLVVLPENLAVGHICAAAPFKNRDLIERINEFIRLYRADGTYEDMYRRWVLSKNPEMPDIAEPENPTQTLIVGTDCQNEPMNFMGPEGKVIGFDIEFIRRLALFLNFQCEIQLMKYEALFPAAASGKIDLAVASLDATKERRESMLFTEEYIDCPIAVMIRKADSAIHSPSDPRGIDSVEDLRGKRVASLTGSAFKNLMDPLLTEVQHLYFNDNSDSVQALRGGKVDAVLLDEPVAKMYASHYPETRLACIYAEDSYSFAFPKGSPLRDRANEVIRNLKQSGELEQLCEKWIGAEDSKKQLADWDTQREIPKRNGVLRYGTDPVLEPMCYSGPGGRIIGLDVEIIRRIAHESGMEFEVVPMGFGSLIESLRSGRIDAAGGAMSITEERLQSVDFSQSYYTGGAAMLVRAPKGRDDSEIHDFAGLYEKRIGVMTGSIFDRLTQENFSSSTAVYFNSIGEMAVALETKRIDGFLMDEPQSHSLLRDKPNLKRLAKDVAVVDYAFLFSKGNENLCREFSEQLRRMKHDGTLKEIEKKWFSADPSPRILPSHEHAPPKGLLRMATTPFFEPLCFIRDGEIVGYDVDSAREAAARLGYRLELVSMEWNGFIEAISAGKVDFGGGCVSITEERKQKVLFSEPNYCGGVIVVVRKGEGGQSAPLTWGQWIDSCRENLLASFDRTFVRENRWKLILEGLRVTVLIALSAAFFGTILSFGVCAMRRSRWALFRWIVGCFIAIMQGTPMLVILMLLYYVAFASINIDAILVAVIAFSLNFSVYIGELMRTTLDGIPRGQYEAAFALGFRRTTAFRKIIFPQVLRRMLPVYRGELITMLKLTAIVGYIAIQDLTKMSDIIRSRTYEAFFPLLATAIIYLVVARLLAGILSSLGRRLDPQWRRARRMKRETK